MKKILFVATVPQHFIYFHVPCFEMLRDNGWEVHVACSGTDEIPCCDRRFTLPIERSPFSRSNLDAYRQLKKIIDENGYDVVHCHTPVGGAVARLAARAARKKGTRVYYTAHGFHFCKGAPAANWMIYFPAERFLSRLTDELVTINDEDYDRAKRLLKAKNTRLIHGVGCRLERYGRAPKEEKSRLRKEYGFGDDEKLIFYAAEQNKNKNQGFLIETVCELRRLFPSVRLLLAGQDNIDGEYRRLAERTDAPVSFLGVRDDIAELMKLCDVYAASSLREGLPLNIMEAMASGLPVVAVNNRGHRALVADGETGFIVAPGDISAATERITEIFNDESLYERLSENATERIHPFGTENVLTELKKLYGIQ